LLRVPTMTGGTLSTDFVMCVIPVKGEGYD
jgi:hypothetical protein